MHTYESTYESLLLVHGQGLIATLDTSPGPYLVHVPPALHALGSSPGPYLVHVPPALHALGSSPGPYLVHVPHALHALGSSPGPYLVHVPPALHAVPWTLPGPWILLSMLCPGPCPEPWTSSPCCAFMPPCCAVRVYAGVAAAWPLPQPWLP